MYNRIKYDITHIINSVGVDVPGDPRKNKIEIYLKYIDAVLVCAQ